MAHKRAHEPGDWELEPMFEHGIQEARVPRIGSTPRPHPRAGKQKWCRGSGDLSLHSDLNREIIAV